MRRSAVPTLVTLLLLAGVGAVWVAIRDAATPSGSGDAPEPGRSAAGEDDRPTPADAAPQARPRVTEGAESGDDSGDGESPPTEGEDWVLATVEGVVTRADTGEPVEGVTVHVVVRTVPGACIVLSDTSVTDVSGKWHQTTARGETRVYAQGGGWVSKAFLEETDGAWPGTIERSVRSGTTERFDIVVVPAARIAVRVLDADGAPVAGASVEVTVASDSVGRSPEERPTDVEGRFVVPDLVPGVRYTVRAATETCAPARQYGVSVASGETAEIELRLPPPRSIEVVVLDEETAAPVAGATVKASPVDLSTPSDDRKAVTDGGGRARLVAVPPGEVHLEVEAPEHLAPPEPVALASDQGISGAVPRTEIRLRRAANATLSVLDPDGAPLPNCLVRVYAEDGDADVCSEATDSSGVAVLRHLDPASRYVVAINAANTPCNAAPRRIEGWAPAHDVVHLARGLTIEGSVVDPAGHPVAGAWVLIESAKETSRDDLLCDDKGRFRFLRLVAGEYMLRSRDTDDAEFVPPPEVRVPAGARDVRVVQDPRGVVSVSVTDELPQFLEQDVVILDVATGETESLSGDWDSATRRVAGLVRGTRYRVRRANWKRGRWAAAEFVAGKDTEVTLTLAPGKTIAGRVADPGDCLGGSVTASRDGLERDAEIGADGSFRFPGLAPGPWTISASWFRDDAEEEVEAAVVVEAGREDVVLAPR